MKVRTSALRGFALLALSSLAFAACDKKTPVTPVTPTPISVQVVPSSATLTVGQTQGFAAVVSNATSNTGVTWSSSATGVASVSATGTVTAVSPGTAVITATSAEDPTRSGIASVTVNAAAPATIQLIPASASVAVNGTVTLVAIVTGSTAAPTFASSNTNVATVNQSGVVTGVSVGTSTVTATIGSAVAQSQITVVAGTPTPVVTVTITPTSASGAVGSTQQFVATVQNATNTAVTWSSSDESVATVDANGLATATGQGTAVITARSVEDTTKFVTANFVVSPTTPPSISIQSVVSQATGLPVAPNTPIVGTLSVTVNVSAGSATNISRVQVRLRQGEVDRIACEQTFNPPLAPTQGVAQITCPIATAALDANGVPVWPNGTYELTAVALSGTDVVATATYGNLIFANPNVLAVVLSSDGGSVIGGPTSVAPGLLWQDGNLIATVRPAMYAGGTVASVRVCITAAVPTANSVAIPAGICQNVTTSTDNAFTATFSETAAATVAAGGTAGIEATGLRVTATSITTAGAVGPGPTTSNAINYDNQAPIVNNFLVNNAQYVNGSFIFSGAAGCTTPPYTGTCFAMSDFGSDSPAAVYNVQTVAGVTVTGGANITNPSGLQETATSTERILQVVVTDLLGNTRTVYATAGGAPSTTVAGAARFGIDLTAPTIQVTGPANNSSNPATNVYNFTFLDAGTVVNGTVSGPSGFSATPLQIRVEQFVPNGTGGVVRSCINPLTGAQLAGQANGCTTAGGFVTTGDDAGGAGVDVTLPFGTVDAYFQVTGRVRDFAGNLSDEVVRVTLDDQLAPVVGNIVTPTSITGGQQVTFSAQMQDNTELGDQLGYVGFNAINTFLVTDRDMLASYGFDVLSTPLNATHTIEQFIRSIETTAGNAPSGTIATATDMNLAVRDMAGMRTATACPAAGVIGTTQPGGPFTLTGSCRTVQTSIINAVSLGMGGLAETSWSTAGRPFGTTAGAGNANNGGVSFTNTTTGTSVCSNIPVGANAGCNVVTATTKQLTATATGPAQTFANPFARVVFYYTDAQGRSFPIGTGSVTVTDNTVTNIRTWTYTVTWNPGAMGVSAATYPTFALGIDAQGRALMSSAVNVTVTSD